MAQDKSMEKKESQNNAAKGIDPQKMQELQILEQNLQNTMMQKQAFQMELSETRSALSEIEKADDDVFKIVGQMMIKSDKKKVLESLKNKEKMLNLRMNSLEKQEKTLSEKADVLKRNLV